MLSYKKHLLEPSPKLKKGFPTILLLFLRSFQRSKNITEILPPSKYKSAGDQPPQFSKKDCFTCNRNVIYVSITLFGVTHFNI
jgi:hypothetical protein